VPKGNMLNSVAKPHEVNATNQKVYVVVQDKRSLLEVEYGEV